MAAQEKLIADLREELAFLKEQGAAMSKVSVLLLGGRVMLNKQENKSMSSELNELRITAARLESEGKDATITLDTYKDKIAELQRDIDEQRAKIEDLKKTQSREKEEEKEKRKQEMLSEMMSKIDMVGWGIFDKSTSF